MTTDAITCPSCSAADRSTADAHGVHVCEYCGIRYRLRRGQPHALPPPAPSPWRSPQVLVALAAVLGLGFVLGRSTDRGTEPPAPPAEPAPVAPTPPPNPRYTPPAPLPTDEPELEFVHDGTRVGHRGTLYVLGRVSNASAFPVESAAVTVVLLDEQEREVGVHKGYAQAPVIEPGESTPISIMVSDPPAHARMAFEAEARAADPTAELPALRVVDPIAEPSREGSRWSFRGRIVNEGDVPLRFVRVIVFGISADGKTLGEHITYANTQILAPGQSARWVAENEEFVGTPVRFEYVPRGDFAR